MKINEIDNEDAVFIKTAGIQYDFEDTLKGMESRLILLKNSTGIFSTKLYNIMVAKTQGKIEKFISACERNNIPRDDPHVLRAIEIFNELDKIKKP